MKEEIADLVAVLLIIVPAAIAFGYWQDSWAAGLAFGGMLIILDH